MQLYCNHTVPLNSTCVPLEMNTWIPPGVKVVSILYIQHYSYNEDIQGDNQGKKVGIDFKLRFEQGSGLSVTL